MIRYTVTAAKPSGPEWHGPGSVPDNLHRYHEANSLRGIRRAVAVGARWIDNDYMTTADGIIVCNHSFGAMQKESFDSEGIANKPIDQLTWDQVRRLEAPDGTRIQRIETMMPAYAEHGIGVALELKGDGREGFRLITEAHMDHIVDLANRHGVRMYGKASPERPRLLDGLAMLRERGVWTRATGTTDWQAPEEEIVEIIRYEDWSRRPRGATRSTHPIGSTRGITAHWEGPRMGTFAHSRCADKVRGIQAFHRDSRGWADIAYNAVVCPHGYVFEGRGPGVKSAANGNATTNADWYAVCYLGGQGDDFTAEGRAGFLAAFGWLEREGDAGPLRNGHRDHKATACPGDTIYRWVHSLPSGAGTTITEEDDLMGAADDILAAMADDRRIARDRYQVYTARHKYVVSLLKSGVDTDALADKITAGLIAGGSVESVDYATVKRATQDAIRELVEE